MGRFGHHPDPAIDFCVEVEAIEAEVADRAAGLVPTTDLPKRIEAALSFRVGGDKAAIQAKAALRRLAHPSTPEDARPLREAVQAFLKANDAGGWRDLSKFLTEVGKLRRALSGSGHPRPKCCAPLGDDEEREEGYCDIYEGHEGPACKGRCVMGSGHPVDSPKSVREDSAVPDDEGRDIRTAIDPLPPQLAPDRIEPGDHVRHHPTGEDWIVRAVHGDKLEWAGWPPNGRANISDCTLLRKGTESDRAFLGLAPPDKGAGS